MGLPGLRGPPGTKVSHIFTTSYTQLCVCLERKKASCSLSLTIIMCCYIPCVSFQGLPGYKGEKVSSESLLTVHTFVTTKLLKPSFHFSLFFF